MATFVLDASALLALIQVEAGAERVTLALEQGGCRVSAMNLCEVVAKLITVGVPAERAEAIVLGIPAEIVPCDAGIALKAGRLAAMGKTFGLSLGDRVCLATAQSLGGLVLTADQAWRKVAVEGVAIEFVREPVAPAMDKSKGH